MPAERSPAQGDDEEQRAPDLDQQVAGDEQPRAPVEGVGDRGRHEQAGEHQPDQQQPHRQPVRVEPVRPPRDHVPRVDDCERHDRRLGAGPQVDVLEQVVRELPDREDVDEVEEQLERGDDALRAGRPRDGNPHRGDPTRVARDGRFPCQRRPPVPPAPRLRRDCFLGLPRSVRMYCRWTMNFTVRPCADRLGSSVVALLAAVGCVLVLASSGCSRSSGTSGPLGGSHRRQRVSPRPCRRLGARRTR